MPKVAARAAPAMPALRVRPETSDVLAAPLAGAARVLLETTMNDWVRPRAGALEVARTGVRPTSGLPTRPR